MYITVFKFRIKSYLPQKIIVENLLMIIIVLRKKFISSRGVKMYEALNQV